MLLFDDSFSSLDRDTMLKLFEAVFGSGGLIEQWNPTVILVTHCCQYFRLSIFFCSFITVTNGTQWIYFIGLIEWFY